jgi:hypothetical protein
MTPLGKPVRRVVDIPGEGLHVVSLTLAGITFRKFRSKKEFILPYGNALLRAAALSVGAEGITVPRKRRR